MPTGLDTPNADSSTEGSPRRCESRCPDTDRTEPQVTAAINISIIGSDGYDYPNIRLILNQAPTIDFIDEVSVENFHSVAVLRMISARVG